ncbi:uncharacterized protein LOC141673249 [Apium graveolens]|uniref:uncharacterized protein LOC141673249 n=1 Tax=Apium graveolens TaxID=4045 RepID=UPI003D7A4381
MDSGIGKELMIMRDFLSWCILEKVIHILKKTVWSLDGLTNVTRHIDKVINCQSLEEVKKNRVRLRVTIEVVRYLSLQACALRGHDESSTSHNRGNLTEIKKVFGRLSVDISNVVLENAPKMPCIISKVLIFDIVNVADTTSLTLQKEISNVLTRNNLSIHNMRGQGYDGASNMRGAFNDLQALFLKDFPYAYYVHCFAHRLQLALVGAEKQDSIWEFFSILYNVVNIVVDSSKRLLELQTAHGIEVDNSVASGERETGRGLNQIENL